MALSGQPLIALIIDRNLSFAQSLETNLRPEISLDEVEILPSLQEAFQSLVDRNFNLCLISQEFQSELDGFFRDMQKLGRDKTCSFVQLWDVMPKEISQVEVRKLGFVGYVSKALGRKEKMLLRSCLEGELKAVHITQSLTKVHDAVEVLLRELDTIARRKRRGKDAELDYVVGGYIKRLTNLDATVLEHYFDELCSSTSLAKAFADLNMQVPGDVAARNLPQLSTNGYEGQSERVFELLASKYATTTPKE